MKFYFWLSTFLVLTFSMAFGQLEGSFVYTDNGRRDPCLPLVDESGRYLLDTESSDSSAELRLSGILWDPQGKSSCLINNQIVKVGESVSGFMIKSITKDTVTLSKDSKECILRLSIEEEPDETQTYETLDVP